MYTIICSIVSGLVGWYFINEYWFGVLLFGFVVGLFIDILRCGERGRSSRSSGGSFLGDAVDIGSDFLD